MGGSTSSRANKKSAQPKQQQDNGQGLRKICTAAVYMSGWVFSSHARNLKPNSIHPILFVAAQLPARDKNKNEVQL